MPMAAPVESDTVQADMVEPVANVIVQPVAVVPSVTWPEKSVPVTEPGLVPQDETVGVPGLAA